MRGHAFERFPQIGLAIADVGADPQIHRFQNKSL
jgi:hypothetical protein